MLVAFRMRATGLPMANNKKENRRLVKKIVSKIGYMLQYRGSPTTTMSIGKQDTLDEEMMVEYNYQIETPADHTNQIQQSAQDWTHAAAQGDG